MIRRGERQGDPACAGCSSPIGAPFQVCAQASQSGTVYSTADGGTFVAPPCGSAVAVAVTVPGPSGGSLVNTSLPQTVGGRTSTPSLLVWRSMLG